MKARQSRYRTGDLSIGEALMVALRMTAALQEVNIRTGSSTSPVKEKRDSAQGGEAEDEEIEGEVVGDAGVLLPTGLLNKQRQIPSTTFPLYPRHPKNKNPHWVRLQLHRNQREMNYPLSSRLQAMSLRTCSLRLGARVGQTK